MIKFLKIVFVFLLFLFLIGPEAVFAQNSFVSIVNPIRGSDFWDNSTQKVEDGVQGQLGILKKFNLPATWLLRFDALENKNILNLVNERNIDEKGLFLEITPSWATKAGVKYHSSESWHSAASAFLTGYDVGDREKLIDAIFDKFKNIFNVYPKSVGAWWIDSHSLSYMQKKYGITSAMIVSDQYSTDNYQIWGQYFSTPYYPSKNNALHPAQTLENKLPIVITQWAARDPVNSYGNGVSESTFSVQANDYIDYHNLDTKYFSKLLDIYSKQPLNIFSHTIIGLENSYSWEKYKEEYQKQTMILVGKKNSGQISIISLKDFSTWYMFQFPNLSPEQIIIADDPLGSFKKVVWFMNPYYRAAWFYNDEGSVFRDIRQYINGEEELCFQKKCDAVNFATSATRVLDEVSFGHKWIIDKGNISNFKVEKEGENYLLSYQNQAGNSRSIEFLPRDIALDGKISTIDGAILDATKKDLNQKVNDSKVEVGMFKWSFESVVSKIVKFLLFLIICCFIPGYVITHKLLIKNESKIYKLFLSSVTGLVMLTFVFYLFSLIQLKFLIYLYILTCVLIFLKFKLFKISRIESLGINKFNLLISFLITLGTIFQNIPTFKSGLLYPFGLGFWGPNTHDGVWHISLIKQLIKSTPPENPIFSGTTLKNYHFFYDLSVAITNILTQIPVADLVFRLYPILFSAFLGIGTYFLIKILFESKLGIKKTQTTQFFGLYLVYFAGSFGWIVDFIKQRSLGGESAFWANQSVSFNLNPPFAISLIIIIAFLCLLTGSKKIKSLNGILVLTLLAGTLVGFKAYGAILLIGSLFIVGTLNLLKKDFTYILISIFSAVISLGIFLLNFQQTKQLIILSPFWFIHSMIDSPDRVGWVRLSLAREAGIEKNNWFKFISAEAASLLIFIIGNLGVRFLSLAALVKIKSIGGSNNFLLILLFSSLSILIPMLFIQSGNPWNTIQFAYYGLYTAAVIGGLVLSYLIFSLPRFLSIALVVSILILAPINSITTASYYLGRPHAIISNKELEGLGFLSSQMNGTVLTYSYDDKIKQRLPEPWPLFVYDSTAYASALSGKNVYVEDEPQNQILLTDYKKRLVASNDFFVNSDNRARKNFLGLNKIKYIYLPKYFNISMDEFSLNLKTIFENEEVKIYQRT